MATRAAKAEKTEKAEKVKKTEAAETAEKTAQAEKTEAAKKTVRTARAGKTEKAEKLEHSESEERDLTRDDIIHRYLDIYRRCMAEDPKSFDARGAAHALEQISKLLGLTVSAKDTDGNEIVLTLSEEADVFGQ